MAKRDGFSKYMAAAGFNDSNTTSSDSSVSVRASREGGSLFPASSQPAPSLAEMRQKLMQRLKSSNGASGSQSQRSHLMDLIGDISGRDGAISEAGSTRTPPKTQISGSHRSLLSMDSTHHESRMAGLSQSGLSARGQRDSRDLELTARPGDDGAASPRIPRKSRPKPPAAENQPPSQRTEFNPKDYSTPFIHPEHRVSQGDLGRDLTFEGEFSRPSQNRPGPKSRTERSTEAAIPPYRSGDKSPHKSRLAQPEEEEEEEYNIEERGTREQLPRQRTQSPVTTTRATRQTVAVSSEAASNLKTKKQRQKHDQARKPDPKKAMTSKSTSEKTRRPKTAKTASTVDVDDDPPLFADTDPEEEVEPEPIASVRPSPASPAVRLTSEVTARKSEPKTTKTIGESKARGRPPRAKEPNEPSTSRQDKSTAAAASRDRLRVRETLPTTRRSASKGRRKQPEPQMHGRNVSRMIHTIKQIKELQHSTNLLIPRLPFTRVVREVTQEIAGPTAGFRYTADALEALQTITEYYLTALFSDANRVAAHANRVTVMPKDLELLRLLGLVEH